MNNKKLKKSTVKKIALIASLIGIFVFLTGKNFPDIFGPKESSPSQTQVIQNVNVYTMQQDTSSEGLKESSPTIPPEITPVPTPEITPMPTPEITPAPTPEITPMPTPEITPMPTPVEPTPKANSIIHQPESIEVYPSDTARFTVGTSGAVKSYMWQYLKPGESWKNITVSIFPSATTDTLTFIAHDSHNGFQYRCIVHFENGTTEISDAAKITVKSY